MAVLQTGLALLTRDNTFSGDNTFSNPIDAPELGNTSGDLKLNPTAAGDVTLFEDTDVGDGVHGKSLYIHRKAAEGDDFLRFYINNARGAILTTAATCYFESTAGLFHLQAGAAGNVRTFVSSTSGENRAIQTYGYITAASAAKYGYLQVDDTNDELLVGLEDSNLTGVAVKLSDAAGAADFRIRDSAGALVHNIDSDGNVTMADAADVILNTTTGTKIGTATTQKLGFWNATPVVQQAHIADATTQDIAGGDTVDETKLESDLANIVAAVNAILAQMATLGLQAAS